MAADRSIEEFVRGRIDAFTEDLFSLLRIPSVSTDPARREDVARCAQAVAEELRRAGLEPEIVQTSGHPIVYAERIEAPELPSVLVYGHYDVQPPDPLEEWRHPPFEPAVEEGYVYARGASDDKGQFLALAKGIETALAVRGRLGVNVKVICEGEEEVGSASLHPFVTERREALRADTILIADCAQLGPDLPAITYGLKGLVYLELVVRGPARDLHSGSYGGAVQNPANALCRMLAACFGPFGKVAIPGFYDDVRPLDPEEREEFARLPFDEETFRKEVGAPALAGEEGYTTLERKWARPTFDINGLLSGFTGEGAKTVLPAVARAKFSMRLVPDQDPEKIADLVTGFLHDVTPPGVTIEVVRHHGARPVLARRDGPAVEAAARAVERAFGRRPFFVREGGSIPVVNTFQEVLGTDVLLLGLGLPGDNIHAPNERFRLKEFERGIVTMAAFLEEFARTRSRAQ